MSIYLDNSATTPVKEEVARVIYKALTEEFGNPSSLHGLGVSAEKKVEMVRKLFKKIMGIKKGKIVFTSGGSESNNLAIFGAAKRYRRNGNHLITTKIEHPSVLKAFEQLEEDYEVTYLPVDERGELKLDSVREALREDTILISIQQVNNEIGSIQPVAEVGEFLKSQGHPAVFHCDGVQGLTKLPLRPESSGIDLLSFSGHKFHGPKGVGGLYIGESTDLIPLIFGGGQEEGFRPGTENVPGVLGMGKALDLVYDYCKEKVKTLYNNKNILCTRILNNYPGTKLIGPGIYEGAPHILSIGFKNFKGEVLLHALEEKGLYVSPGAACSSRKTDKSRVLEILGVPDEFKEGVLRFSLSYFNTREELECAADKVVEAARELEGFVRR